ncbi:MAG: autotransporter-associated beta strand repeat-containing protein [Planctomycetia bacterium]|nr:autotransporter-associated beta strand repeat-containing protein [Planctomycetia bacterium]
MKFRLDCQDYPPPASSHWRSVDLWIGLGLILMMGFGTMAHAVEIGPGTTITVDRSNWETLLPDDIIFSGGTLSVDSTAAFTITRNAAFTANTSSIINSSTGSNNTYMSGAFSGSGTVTKTGGQQLHLSGNNSAYTGTLNHSNNWINFLNSNATFSSGTVHFNGGTGFVLTPSASSNVFAFGMITSGTGTPEIRATSGSVNPATLQVGGTNASGTFTGKMLNQGDSVLSVTKVGTGTWILTGANTYTGATTISGGTLQLGNGGSTGTLAGMLYVDGAYSGTPTAITVEAGAKLAFNQTSTLRTHNTITFNDGTLAITRGQVNLGGTIAGTKLTKTGTGTAYFQGGTAHNNATVTVEEIVVNEGILANKATMTADTTSITVNKGGTFQLGSPTFSTTGSVNASTAITIHTGGTFSVFGGTITNAITFDGGNITSNTGSATFSGALTGTGLVKIGTGTVTLTQNYAGTVGVSAGTLVSTAAITGNITVNDTSSVLRLGTGGSTGSLGTSNTITLSDGGTFGLNHATGNNYNLANNITISNGGTIANYGAKNLVLQGTVSGDNLTLSNEGNGILFLQDVASDRVSDFTGLTGTLTIAKGLVINKNNAVGNATNPLSVVVKDGATLQMGNTLNSSVSKIYGTIAVESGANLTLGYAPSGTTATYANDISGSGSISAASGTTELTGDNSDFTGTVTVNQGLRLLATGNNTLGNSTVTLRNNSTLEVTGDQNLKSLTLGENSDLTLKSGTVSVTDTFTSATGSDLYFTISELHSALLALNGSATFEDSIIYLDTEETLDSLKIYEFLQTDLLEGLTFLLSDSLMEQGMVVRYLGNGYAVVNPATVPEPATWLLFLLAGLGIGWRRIFSSSQSRISTKC